MAENNVGATTVNWLKEIMEFYSRLLVYPLNGNAQALWFAFMYIYNRAGWRLPMSVREEEIRSKAGLTHKQFMKARADLINGGYIIHNTQAGSKPALYWVCNLENLRVIEAERGALIDAN